MANELKEKIRIIQQQSSESTSIVAMPDSKSSVSKISIIRMADLVGSNLNTALIRIVDSNG